MDVKRFLKSLYRLDETGKLKPQFCSPQKNTGNLAPATNLTPFESIRKRPGMYIGSNESGGLLALLNQLLDNFILLSPKPESLTISIELLGNTITLRSSCIAERSVKSWEFYIFTVANILSEKFSLIISDGSECIGHTYQRGLLVKESAYPPSEKWKLEVQLSPDPTIFAQSIINYYAIYERCFQLATLYSGMEIFLMNEAQHNRFYFKDGLTQYFYKTANPHSFHQNIFYFKETSNDVTLQASLAIGYRGLQLSFVNNYQTPDHGSHVDGLLKGILHAFHAVKQRSYSSIKDVQLHMQFVVSVMLDCPNYTGGLRDGLDNPEIVPIITRIVKEKFSTYLQQNPAWSE